MNAASVIYALDLDRMEAFYGQGLGLATVDRADSYRVLESGAWSLTLVKAPSRIAATIEVTFPPRRRVDAPIKLVFAVLSLAEARVRAAALGGQIDTPDTEWEFRGSRRCDGIDPEGNVIQLQQS